MPRVTEAHRQAQRRRITEAALVVAREHGIGGVSMSDVIKESGLSAGAIYGYFKNKDELLTDIAAGLVTGRLEVIDELARRRPAVHPLEVVRALVLSAPSEVVEGGLVLEVWASGSRDVGFASFAREQLVAITDTLARYLVVWFESRGRPEAEAARLGPALAPALLGLAQGYLVRTAVEGRAGGAAYLDSLEALADCPLW